MSLINKFVFEINKFAQGKSEEFYSSFNDPVGWGRKALSIDGSKYPADMSGEAKLPDGRPVKLISIDEAKSKGLKHRLYIECKWCNKWIPAGRLSQHEPSCTKKHAPAVHHDKLEFKKKVNEALDKINHTDDDNERYELCLVLEDMLKENGDLGWNYLLNSVQNNAEFYKLRAKVKDHFADIKHMARKKDGIDVTLNRDDPDEPVPRYFVKLVNDELDIIPFEYYYYNR